MNTADTRGEPHGWSTHLRGHLLQFDPKPAPELTTHTCVRLLLAAVLLEIVRLAAVEWLRPGTPLGLILPALLVLAVLGLPMLAGIGLSQLGLCPWREWTTTERSYWIQVMVIANVVFPIILAPRLESRAATPDPVWTLWHVFVPYLCFGFYQELVYRGAVQSAFVRVWSAPRGILVANLLYTFGPLHWGYFGAPFSLSLPMFAAIFAVGLFFGVLYERSGNLWLATSFHAIGNAYIVWSVGSVQ